MEVGRKMSVEREKMCVSARSTLKKVEIVYYLSRNGHLEHPHYMELTHLAHQHLRLKDVVDRLTVLRGKGMPSLYSWSCKRSYKNGYVWNDLAENDVIYPSQGAEYVLKGSQVVEDCTEKLRHLQVGNVHVQLGLTQESSLIEPKRKSLTSKPRFEAQEMTKDGGDEEEEEYEEKTCYTSSTTPRSRRSRGVSTDEIEEPKTNNVTAQVSLDANSFSSTTSSTLSEKSSISKRFEEGDGVGNEPLLSRNTMLLSLITCGGSASFRKAAPPRKSGSSQLQKWVVCKAAAAADVDDEDQVMIGSLSENPRFGKLQSEEKEYFSGSIVEAAAAMERIDIEGLKKSSSHNQERSAMAGLVEAADEELQKIKGVKGKCMPLKKSSYKHSNK